MISRDYMKMLDSRQYDSAEAMAAAYAVHLESALDLIDLVLAYDGDLRAVTEVLRRRIEFAEASGRWVTSTVTR